MIRPVDQPRKFLFLQGPHGPFFALLGSALRQAGYGVYRINLNGGDKADWVGDAVDYRGRARNWPLFVDEFLLKNDITDLILYGDCRPLHFSAHGIAGRRNVRVYVAEEGYIRPDFITLEEGGVNGYSGLPRDPQWYINEAQTLPPLEDEPGIPSDLGRRLRCTGRYALATEMARFWFPDYKSHRPTTAWLEAAGWAVQLGLRERHAQSSVRIWEEVRDTEYFFFPLQLNSDFQIRIHSPFGDMRTAAQLVIKSFARNAPATAHLLVKRHPLDPGLINWGNLCGKAARAHGVADRVHYVPSGDIDLMIHNAQGVVTVNSTVGTLALKQGVAVSVMGNAVYNLPGLVDQQNLDTFWQAPAPPHEELYDAFCRVLRNRCLIHGGYFSDIGLDLLVRNAMKRLTDPVAAFEKRQPGRACAA